MAKNRKKRVAGPAKQAARAARERRERRLMEVDPLFHGAPPYEGYREWMTPDPLTGTFTLTRTAPPETRAYFARMAKLLVPIYRGKVPMAATYLDDRIKSGVIVLAHGDGDGAGASVLPVADLAAELGEETEHCRSHPPEICPQLNCAGEVHMTNEHRVWAHLHHLHAAGRFLLNDKDAVRLTIRPDRPGERWQFIPTGPGTRRISTPPSSSG